MNSSVKNIILGIVGVILFAIGIVCTIGTVNASKEVKIYDDKYQILLNVDKTFNDGKLSTKTELAKENVDKQYKKFKQNFALSLLLYFGALLDAVLIFFSSSNKSKKLKE